MQKGTLYSMEEFKLKHMREGEGIFKFIERMFSSVNKSASQIYRDMDKSNVRVFTSGTDIKILLEAKDRDIESDIARAEDSGL